MPKQYKVIAGAFPYLQRNKVYEAHEILTEDDLNEGDAEKAIQDGFIEEISESEPETESPEFTEEQLDEQPEPKPTKKK